MKIVFKNGRAVLVDDDGQVANVKPSTTLSASQQRMAANLAAERRMEEEVRVEADEIIAPLPLKKITDAVLQPQEFDAPFQMQDSNSWFTKGAYKDGKQTGDFWKTLFGTGTDAADDLGTGLLGIGEKLADGWAAIAPVLQKSLYYQNGGEYRPFEEQQMVEKSAEQSKEFLGEFIKKDLYDEAELSKRILSGVGSEAYLSNIAMGGGVITEEQLANANKMQEAVRAYMDGDMEKDSVLGAKADAVVQSGGQMLGTAALSAAGVPWWMTTGTTAFGSEAESALNNGATYDEAVLSGAISAASEVLTEKLGGISFGGATLDDEIVKQLAKGISNKFVRNALAVGVKGAGEGIEEWISNAISEFGQSITYGDPTTIKELLFDEEALDAAIGGFLMSGVSSSVNAVKSAAQGVDYASGMTKNEQKVVDKVYKDRIAEEKKNSKGKVTEKRKSEIYNDVLNSLEKGYISTDTIEEVLGGESYKTYKNTVDSEDAIRKEYEDLGKKTDATLAEQTRFRELHQQVVGLKNNSKRNELKAQLGKEVMSLVQNDRLAESYNERSRRGQAYQADISQYDTKQRATIQKAIDSGILNNTNRTHEFVDLIAKITADKGVSFDFTNNERLKESGFAIKGATVNGYVTNDGVTLNIDSAKALNSVVGHEITHVLEGTELYDILSKTITEYAKSKGEYKTRLAKLTEIYKDVEDADVSKELVADLVGDYLFTDAKFIQKLTENRNVFQKVWDEIKYLCKVATAGSEEARQLERAKALFEEAFRATKNTAAESGVKLNISRTQAMSWADQIDGALYNGKNIRRNDTLIVGNPADTAVANEIENKPLAIPLSVLTKASNGKDISHSIKKGKLAKLDEGIKNAPITIVNPDRNAVVYVTNIKQGGLPVIAAFDMNATFDGDEVHKATSIHLQVDMQTMLENLPESATVYVRKNELDPVGATNNLRGLAAKIKFIEGTITQENQNVKHSPSDAQQEFTTESEVQFSLSNDTAYMDKAIAANNASMAIDSKVMEEAKTLREKIAGRMNEIKDRGLVALPEDMEGDTYIANSSYDGTEENTTICPRSLASEAFVDAVSEYLGRPLTVEEQIYISQDLQGRTLTPECLYCYVATDRKAYRAFLGEYGKQRDAVLQKLKANPDIDVSQLHKDHQALKKNSKAEVSPVGELYKEFLNGRKVTDQMYNRFKMWTDAYLNGTPMIDASHLANINKLMGDIKSEFGAELKPQIVDAMKYAQSASWAKKRVNYVAYNGHILKWKQNRINKLNSHYGLRMYSFSDFHPAFVLENMQMITDASVRGLKMLGYTKDTDFVEIFAPTGMNINVSTFGFESGGHVFENNIIGAEWEKAKALREQYPNVGVTFVATNDTIVEWALAQDWIDVVIPYHLVRTGAEVAKALNYTNYTSESSDTKTADWKKGDKKYIAPTEHNNDKATYLAALEKNHLKPRFERYKNNPNYMKLVNECRQPASESKPVQPVFNEDAAMKALAKLEANGYYQPIGGSVDRMYEIAAEVAENMTQEIGPTKAPKYSLSANEGNVNSEYAISPETDKNYLDAVNRGDTEATQKMVDEAAKAAGYAVKAWHGTPNSDFVAFDRQKIGSTTDPGIFGSGFYFTTNKGTADGYATKSGRTMPVYLQFNNPWWATANHNIQEVAEKLGMAESALSLRRIHDRSHVVAPIMSQTRQFASHLLEHGYDSVVVQHGKGDYEIVVFDPERIKSAEPVTYDDNGNAIPLSERFNADSNDIRYSMSQEGEDIAPVGNYNVYGSDMKLDVAPVRDDGTWGDDPERFDSLDDADAPPVWDDIGPVKGADQEPQAQTVKEQIAQKIANFQTELENNARLRDQSRADFDAEIARLQAAYDGLANKNTMKANDLLRRIERRQRMKNNVDADYARRIANLEERIERMSTPTYQTAAQRQVKQQAYATQMEQLVGDTTHWVDKKLGMSYKVNTLKRNLRDVVRREDGSRDIQKADAIYEELQGKYNHNEAKLNREANRIKGAYAKLKITKAEDAYIQMLGELRYNPETTLSEEVVSEFYEKHKRSIDKAKVDKVIADARKTYDELLIRVNEVLKEQGMKEIPYRKGYFPHFTEDKQSFLAKLFNWKVKNNDIPTDIAGMTEQFTPNRSWQSFNKQRTSDTTDYSFMKGMDTYVQGALDWIYHIEDIQKRRAFENHIRYIHSEQGVKDRIDAIRKSEEYDADQMQDQIDLVYAEARNPLNNFVTNLRTGTNTLANKKSSMDRGMEEDTNRRFYSTMTNISNRVSTNMVGGSISSALTNFIPITQSWGVVSPVSSLRAMGDTIRSTFRDDGMVNKSDFLTNRLNPSEKLYQSGWDKVSDKVGFLMEAVDSFTSQTVWRSKYLENISSGMSENEAVRDADEFAEGVMAGRSRGNMPTIFDSKNPLIKTLTAFQLEVANQYGYMFKDMPQDMKNDSLGKLTAGYAKMFLGAYAYNALYSKLTGRDAAFDPIGIIEDLLRDLGWLGDEEEEETVDAILNFTDNILEETPFVGGLLGGGRIPISSALPYDGVYEAFTGTMQDIANKDYKNLTKEWLNPVYYVAMPMGGGQIRKTVQGLSMFSDEHPVSGSYTDSGSLRFPVEDTVGNRIKAGIFGQWSSEAAQRYIDEGRTPLNSKDIEEFKALNISIEEYWSYQDAEKEISERAKSENATDEDILKSKYLTSVNSELAELRKEIQEIMEKPYMTDEAKEIRIKAVQKRFNELSVERYESYNKVEIDGDFAHIGDRYYQWYTPENGASEWRKLTDDQVTKYLTIRNVGSNAHYATNGDVHYRLDEGGNPKNFSDWTKISDKELERQNEVTGTLGISPEEYWSKTDKYMVPMYEGEYEYAFDNPANYAVAKVVGGYDAYRGYSTDLSAIKADKDANGKSISGSRKAKVLNYINNLDADYYTKIILWKSEYTSDDTYNVEIINYLNSNPDITFNEKVDILKKLGFKVTDDGKISW